MADNGEFWKVHQAALARLKASDDQIAHGLELHRSSFVCDTFGFLPRVMSPAAAAKFDDFLATGPTADEAEYKRQELEAEARATDADSTDFCRRAITAAGVNCISPPVGSEKHLHHSVHRMSLYQRTFDALPELFRKVTGADEVERAHRDGVLGVWCGANCAPVHGGLEEGREAHHWIDVYHRFGIRMMHLTYNRRNWIGDGCMEPDDAGLSLHGREVVKHLNDLGIVVDTPHSGQQTTIDAAKHSRAPIASSHTACAALHPHPRAKRDDVLKAVADGGGLVGIVALAKFLSTAGSLTSLLDHVEHAVNLIGIDHVALATDSAASGPLPPQAQTAPRRGELSGGGWYGAWEHAGELHWQPGDHDQQSLAWLNWPYFTVGLVTRGFDDDSIRKILGGNWLRLLRAVARAAS